jgi:hypothetical protein
MPSRVNHLSRADLKKLYDCIMNSLFEKYSEEYWVKKPVNNSNTEIPVSVKYGHVPEVFNHVNTIGGLTANDKGGDFYEIHRFMRPKKNKEGEYVWKPAAETKKVGKKLIIGLLNYIKEENLIRKIGENEYNEMRLKFTQGLITYPGVKQNKSVVSQENRKTLDRYRSAATSIDFPDDWKTSRWISYERNDLGISQSTIKFEEEGGVVFVTVNTMYIDSENASYPFTYKGIAYKNSGGEFIIINLFRKEVENVYASFIMQLDRSNYRAQKLSIGHASYLTIRYRRYLTKRIIWEKYEDTNLDNFVPKDIKIKDEEYKKIDKSIRWFLQKKELNRLSMPDVPIIRLNGNIDTLKNWMIAKQEFSEKDQVINDLHGEYYLFYFKKVIGDERKKIELKHELLSIKGDERLLPNELSNTEAILFHQERQWKGLAERNNNVLQMNLYKTNEGNEVNRTEPSKIFSLFVYLEGLKENESYKALLERTDSLTGIAMGINDNGNVPVANKICLIEKSKFDISDKSLEELIRKRLNDGNSDISI